MKHHLQQEGIIHQVTPPYAHQMNGQAERQNRTFIEGALSMLAHANMDLSFWGLAVLAEGFIHERSPYQMQDGEILCPQTAKTGSKPLSSMVRVFGCDAYVTKPKEEAKGLHFKAWKGCFVRYAKESKAWLIMNEKNYSL
jgi:hypothetical protein